MRKLMLSEINYLDQGHTVRRRTRICFPWPQMTSCALMGSSLMGYWGPFRTRMRRLGQGEMSHVSTIAGVMSRLTGDSSFIMGW